MSPTRRLAGMLLLPVLLAVSACEDTPTAPADPAADLGLTGLRGDGGLLGAPGARGPGMVLGTLFRRALVQVSEEQGRDAAVALLDEVRAQHEAARAARQAGDRDAALAAMEAVRLRQAEIIVEVLGPGVVDEVMARARESVARLVERVEQARAAGRDVSRIEGLVERVQATLAEAEAAYAAGDLPLALERASRLLGLGHRPGGRNGARAGGGYRNR